MTDLIQQRSSQLVLEVSQLVKWGSVCSECVSSDCSITTPVSGRSIHWSVFSHQYSWLPLHHEDQRTLQATQRKGYLKVQVRGRIQWRALIVPTTPLCYWSQLIGEEIIMADSEVDSVGFQWAGPSASWRAEGALSDVRRGSKSKPSVSTHILRKMEQEKKRGYFGGI